MHDHLFSTEPEPPGSDALFVRVAVERGFDRGTSDAALTYGAHDNAVRVGQAVEVPLGLGNTPTRGIVIEAGTAELLEGYDPKKVKRLTRTLGSPLTPDLVDLARWMNGAYAVASEREEDQDIPDEDPPVAH